MSRTHRSLIAALTLATVLGSAPSGLAQEETTQTFGGSGDNVAVSVSTKDGSSSFTVSFRIVRTSRDVVDNANVAFAFSSCEGCESVAIAMQVVLVGGDPSTVTPQNYAIALNFECTECATLASAYQFVLGVDGNVHFSPEGNRAIAEIRRALEALRRSDGSLEEIQAELDILAQQLRTVLAEELITAGPPDVEVGGTPGAGPTPDPTPSASADPSSPAETVSPPVSPEPTGPAPSPEESETPAPQTSPAETPSPSSSSTPSESPDPVSAATP